MMQDRGMELREAARVDEPTGGGRSVAGPKQTTSSRTSEPGRFQRGL
jgi:hypothetical protein